MPDSASPDPVETHHSLRARVKAWRRKGVDWCGRQWVQVRPGPETRRGAVWGTLVAAALCAALDGLYLRTGFGYAFDFALTIVFAALLIPLAMLAVGLLLTIARHLPRMATGMIVGSCAIVMMVWMPPQLGFPMAIAVGLAEGILGATIATFVAGHFRAAALSKKIVTVSLCLLAVAINVGLLWMFLHEGSMDKITSWK